MVYGALSPLPNTEMYSISTPCARCNREGGGGVSEGLKTRLPSAMQDFFRPGGSVSICLSPFLKSALC